VSASKVRIHEISKQLGVSSASVMEVLSKEFGVQTKSHSSTVDQSVADKVIERFKERGATHTPPVSQNPTRTALAEPVLIKRAPRPQPVPQSARPQGPSADQSGAEKHPSNSSDAAKSPVSGSEAKATPTQPRLNAPGSSQQQPVRRPVSGPTGPMAQAGQQPYVQQRRPQPQHGSSQQGHGSSQQRTSAGGGAHGQSQPRRPLLGNAAAPIRIVPERDPNSPRPVMPQQRMAGSPQGVSASAQGMQQGRPAHTAGGQPPRRPMPGDAPRRPMGQAAPHHGPRPNRPDSGYAPQRPPMSPGGQAPYGPRPAGSDAPPSPADSGLLNNPNKTPGRRHSAPRGKTGRTTSSDDDVNKDLKLNKGRRKGSVQVAVRERKDEVETPPEPKNVQITEAVIVRDLANLLDLRDTEIIKHLFMKGMMVTVNQTLDVDFARELAKELGFIVDDIEVVKHEGEYTHLAATDDKKLDENKFQNLTGRPPVVSIMGHVDHGKTTLLDSIRETRHKVVDGEAGGITQSIGAYTVQRGDNRIVFLDTPGHEAFTSMRMRGAQATDIAILVVAADDGVMPQTIEAINHAKAAKIPIIIAVNKIDKPEADPDKVLVQLAEYGLSAEKWGGDTLTVEVSALQKLGLDDVLDSVLLVSELLELKADATVPGEGVIIEAQLDKRMGPVATALVKNGTLRVGDNILIGSVGGRVRALINDMGQRVDEATPSTPVSILGLDGVPKAGDSFRIVTNDKLFKQELAAEKQRVREERIGVTRSVAGFSGRLETEENKENQFNLLVKADTQGSLEAVLEVLQRMTNDEVKINIVHSATGDISEADVMLASTANALIIGFNSKADPAPQRLAEQSAVNIKLYDVIYHITEDIEKWVLGQLSPETEETHSGTAEIRQIFTVGKTGVIAGCMVTFGKMVRNAKANVMRNGKEIYSGPLSNLKRFKDDAKEVASGYECGISFDKFQDLQVGDQVEVFTVKSMERTSF
jgi:translation initiation factor IF-2